MKEYLLLTVDQADAGALCDRLNDLPITVIKATFSPASWSQWGATTDQLSANVPAVEAVFAALLEFIPSED